MASSIFVIQGILALMMLFVLFSFELGKSETGIAGTGIGYLPEPGGGAGYDGGHEEPGELVVKALKCFNEKHIYSSCEESCRLTESGQLHIPPEYTDKYCNGPCLHETDLVLACIDDIFSHFIFYNHATIKDVKETIKTGCSYGPHRGDFNVAGHIEGYESNSYKHVIPYSSTIWPSIFHYCSDHFVFVFMSKYYCRLMVSNSLWLNYVFVLYFQWSQTLNG